MIVGSESSARVAVLLARASESCGGPARRFYTPLHSRWLCRSVLLTKVKTIYHLCSPLPDVIRRDRATYDLEPAEGQRRGRRPERAVRSPLNANDVL